MSRTVERSNLLEIIRNKKEPVRVTAQIMANRFVGYLKGLKAEPLEIHSRNAKEGVLYTLSIRPPAVPLGNLFTLFTCIEEGVGLVTSFVDCNMKGGNLTFFLQQEREGCGGGGGGDNTSLYIDKDGRLDIPNNTVNGHLACIIYWCSCAMRLSYTGNPIGFTYFDVLSKEKGGEENEERRRRKMAFRPNSEGSILQM